MAFSMVCDAGDNFFARTVGDIQQHFRGVGHALDGSDHLIDGGRSFRNAGGLHLRVLHHVLHVDAHLVHGAGDFFNGRRSLHADFRGFVGGAGHLIRTGGNLSRRIARGAHQILQVRATCARKALPRVSRFERGATSMVKIAFSDGHGYAGHFFQVRDHIVEGGGQRPDFVVAVNVDVLIEVAGVGDFSGDGNQMRQRIGNGFRGVVSDQQTQQQAQRACRRRWRWCSRCWPRRRTWRFHPAIC